MKCANTKVSSNNIKFSRYNTHEKISYHFILIRIFAFGTNSESTLWICRILIMSRVKKFFVFPHTFHSRWLAFFFVFGVHEKVRLITEPSRRWLGLYLSLTCEIISTILLVAKEFHLPPARNKLTVIFRLIPHRHFIEIIFCWLLSNYMI